MGCCRVFENNLVMIIRNVGYVKNAGDVVRKIISNIGLFLVEDTVPWEKAIFQSINGKKKSAL